MTRIAESELILNPDGSIYHLNLKPEHIANTIITVGDQDRVAKVTQFFDTIEFTIQKREFKTQTGTYKGKRITVISTGIGPDNIDIVFNELDALVNIDLTTRTVKKELTSLNIIRIGTSGSIQKNIPVDSFVISKYGLGLDGMIYSYECNNIFETEIEEAFINHVDWHMQRGRPYIVKGSSKLEKKLHSDNTFIGFTATANGFYGPQGRVLRLPVKDNKLNTKMDNFNHNGVQITNFEMETSAMYALAKLLGHQTISTNAIIANRANGTFSDNPKLTVKNLIKYVLDKLVE